MPYDAVSAYTVVLGETGGRTSVTVHGSADQAWSALDRAIRSRGTRWLPRATGESDVAALADRWRDADPGQRFWQVSAHRLQVMVPTAAGLGTVASVPAEAGGDPAAAHEVRPRSAGRPSWRRPA